MKDTLQLKHSFENIKKLRGDISNIFETIHSKINVLKKVYIDMIQTHSKSEYMFGIDAFHFQNELLDIEYNNMRCKWRAMLIRVIFIMVEKSHITLLQQMLVRATVCQVVLY